MKSNLATNDTNFPPSQKIILRRWGVFAFLGAIVFAIQWWFSLGNIGTALLVLGLAVIYRFAFPNITEELQGQNQDSFAKVIFQTIVKFAWLIIAAFVMALFWFWLSSVTGIPSKILAAITLTLAGLGLILWSYIPTSAE